MSEKAAHNNDKRPFVEKLGWKIPKTSIDVPTPKMETKYVS